MNNILNKEIVLAVNSAWQAIHITTVKAAIGAMFSTKDGENLAAKAFVIDYKLGEDGSYDFDDPTTIYPVFLDEWLKLGIRPFDNAIHTSKIEFRVPTVIMAHNFHDMPKKQIHPNKRNLYEMYGGRCIWTGKKLSWGKATVEHMKPKSHGGGDGWGNLGISDKDINNRRGSTLVKDFKYKPQYALKEPKPVPVSALIRDIRHRDWKIFIGKQ